MDKTLVKIEAVGIGKYFSPEQIFTADMVEHGKPKPDLFCWPHKNGLPASELYRH